MGGWIGARIQDVADTGSDIASEVGNVAEQIVSAPQKVVSAINKSVDNIIRNPLPTIETAILVSMGVPPEIASAAVTAANGGNMEQIVLSAAIAYAGGKIGVEAGDIYSPIDLSTLDQLGPQYATEALIKRTVISAAGSASVAAIQGKSLDEVLTASVSGAVATYVSSELTDKGYTNVDNKIINNAVQSATQAILAGKDVTQSITNSVVTTALSETIQGRSNQINKNNELGKSLAQQVNDLLKKDAYFIADNPEYKQALTYQKNAYNTAVNFTNDYNATRQDFLDTYKIYENNKAAFEADPSNNDAYTKANDAVAKLNSLETVLEKKRFDAEYWIDHNLFDANERVKPFEEKYNQLIVIPLENISAQINNLTEENAELIKLNSDDVDKLQNEVKKYVTDLTGKVSEEALEEATSAQQAFLKEQQDAIDKANQELETSASNIGFKSYADQQDANGEVANEYYAKKAGFESAGQQEVASYFGITNGKDWANQLEAGAQGFVSYADMQDAQKKGNSAGDYYAIKEGFGSAGEQNIAAEYGFNNSKDWKNHMEAASKGFQSYDDMQSANGVSAIDYYVKQAEDIRNKQSSDFLSKAQDAGLKDADLIRKYFQQNGSIADFDAYKTFAQSELDAEKTRVAQEEINRQTQIKLEAEAAKLAADAEERRQTELAEAARLAKEAEDQARAEAAAQAAREESARQATAAKEAEDARVAAQAEAKRLADEQVAREKELADAKALADKQAQEQARAQAEVQEQARVAEEARAKADAEAKAQADAQAKAQAEAEAKAQAEAQARAQAEAEAKAQADAQAKAEADRLAQEQLAREEATRQAQEQARLAQEEADRQAQAQAEALAAKEAADAEERRQTELAEAARLAKEAEDQARAEAAAEASRQESARQAEIARQLAESQAQAQAEAERMAEEARLVAEEQARAEEAAQAAREEALRQEEIARQAEQDRLQAEADARAQAEEQAQRDAETARLAEEKRIADEKAQLEKDLGIDNTIKVPVTEVGATMVKGVFKVDANGNYAEYIPDGKGGWIRTGNVHVFANRTPKEGEYTGEEYMVDYDAEDVAQTIQPVTLPPIEDGKVKPVSEVDNGDGTFTQTMSDNTTRVVDMDGNPVKPAEPVEPIKPVEPEEPPAPVEPIIIDGGTGGTSGISGKEITGLSGYSGADIGTSGVSGTSGVGLSGYSGSGISGTSGVSGGSGTSGVSGGSGISGGSGVSGGSGLSGYSGVSGVSGYSGVSGTSGTSGTDKLEAERIAIQRANLGKSAQSIFAGGSGTTGSTAGTTGALATVASMAPTFLTSKANQDTFKDPLEVFHRLQTQSFAGENPYKPPEQPLKQAVQQPESQQNMSDPFYNYGQNQSIDDILGLSTDTGVYAKAGGLMSTPLMATGGMTGTRYGQYATGGLSANVIPHSGKMRVDFRSGDAVTGAGDGQSDDIPAMLADGEFVFPADVVAAIGNGSTKAGSDKLYDMMHGIRSHVRSAKPQDLPPEIKSPLDFLKTKRKKARS